MQVDKLIVDMLCCRPISLGGLAKMCPVVILRYIVFMLGACTTFSGRMFQYNSLAVEASSFHDVRKVQQRHRLWSDGLIFKVTQRL